MNIREKLETCNYNTVSLIEKQLQLTQKKYSVKINVHDIAGIKYIDPQIERIIAPYTYHDNCFCNSVKKHNQCFENCMRQKEKVYEKCFKAKEPFYGSCYMGVEEIVFPIFCKGILIAFLCVGQFAEDMDKSINKIKNNCLKFGLSQESYINKFLSIIKPINVPIDDLLFDMQMLCKTITLLYLKHNVSIINKDSTIINSALAFIKANYKKDISLKDIAANCHCNPNYLSWVFKEKLNVNIINYIASARIENAKELMSITTLSIIDVAMEVGYNDSGYFSKVFKQYCGCTPKEWKSQKRL